MAGSRDEAAERRRPPSGPARRAGLGLLLLAAGGTAAAGDPLLEQAWAAYDRAAVAAAEVRELEAGGQRFLALELPYRTPEPQGGVLLLHDLNGHPDWPWVTSPLRHALPRYGWTTLSLQLPVGGRLDDGGALAQRVAEALPRVEAGVAYFRQRNIYNIVLVGHGLGAATAAAFVASRERSGIAGVVAVGMYPAAANGLADLERIAIPFYDLYGGRDLLPVLISAEERRMAILRGGGEQPRQQRFDGADHFFAALDDDVVQLVRGWLKSRLSGMAVRLDDRTARFQSMSVSTVPTPPQEPPAPAAPTPPAAGPAGPGGPAGEGEPPPPAGGAQETAAAKK